MSRRASRLRTEPPDRGPVLIAGALVVGLVVGLVTIPRLFGGLDTRAENYVVLASTGRNFLEILRVIDSLQLTANYKVATPADWQKGQDCIVVPAVSDADAEKLFPKGVRKVKPYLRYTPQPNL